jgi:hypothetical protein
VSRTAGKELQLPGGSAASALGGSPNTMRILAARKSLVFGSAAILVVGFVAFIVFGQTMKWVGHTDLEVRFIVTDAETGRLIRNATIHIRAESGGFCDDSPQREFTIATDENGEAKQFATNCMCFGSKGAFEDTFASHLPQWSFHATASGYSETDPANLNVSENSRQVQRGDPFATLNVLIRLRKDAA